MIFLPQNDAYKYSSFPENVFSQGKTLLSCSITHWLLDQTEHIGGTTVVIDVFPLCLKFDLKLWNEVTGYRDACCYLKEEPK